MAVADELNKMTEEKNLPLSQQSPSGAPLLIGTVGDESLRTVGGERIVQSLLLGGWAFELRNGEGARAAVATRAALARWVAAGLPVRTDATGSRYYDSVEVLNFMKASNLEFGDPFWSERFVTTGRQLLLDLSGGKTDMMALPPRRFFVHFQRTYSLPSINPDATLRVCLPAPIETARLNRLNLQVERPSKGDFQFRHHPGRLDVRGQVAHDSSVTLAYRTDFTAWPHAGPVRGTYAGDSLDTEATALYTRPQEGFIHVSPQIISLAHGLAKDCGSRQEILAAFWNHLMDNVRVGATHYHEIDLTRPADWVLENGWGNCQLASAVLISLCRALGIPARMVSGYILYPLAPSYHYWAEVWMEDAGWLPFDLLSWDLSAGGRDLAWRDCFAGQMDYRMTTQIFPRLTTGLMGIHLPPRWHLLTQPVASGLQMTIADAATMAPLYSDTITVRTAMMDDEPAGIDRPFANAPQVW
jgi:hypothetical protein